MSGERSRTAAALLWLAAGIVGTERRAEWRAEWEAELWEVVRRGGRGQVRFCLGALRHALWLRGRGWTLDGVRSDARQAVRGLWRAPGFVAASALTLALGIGANATVFTMLNALVLRAPPGIAEPQGLVQIGRGEAPEDFDAWSWPYVEDLRAATAPAFTGLAAWSDARGVMGRGTEARALAVQMVSGEYFEVLGVRAPVGRLIRSEDVANPGSRAVIVLSHGLWRTAFGADPSVVGREVVMDGRTWEVIGVAQPDFAGADAFRSPPAAWVPLTMQNALTGRSDESFTQRGNSWLWTFARLRPGVDRTRAEALTRAAHGRILAAHPELTQPGIMVVEGVGARPADRAAVLRLGALLMATMLVVLWIACANLAGLAAARGAARRGEMAMRAALGADRGRLVRHLVLESLFVACLGGLLAALVAAAASAALPGLMPIPVAVDFAPDARVLAFTGIVALLTVVVIGVAPALAAARTEPLRALRASGVGRGGSAATGRLRRALVVGQVALAFVLLSGATLLVRSVREAYSADPGFRTDGVLTVSIEVGRSLGLAADARSDLLARVVDALSRVPGVHAAGAATVLPVAEPQPNRTPLAPGEMRDRSTPPPPPVYMNTVDAGYFRALGLDLVAGRLFDPAIDGSGTAPVVIVNQTLATRFFPDGDALGAPLRWAGEGTAPVIIGVVRDAPIRSLGERPPAALYSAASQRSAAAWHLVVAADREDAALRADIAAAIAGVEPALPILRIERLDRLVGASLAQTRLTAGTAAAAGALALLLAVIGLHGVIAFTVADRQREFGLRFALGARAADVLRLVLRQAALLAGSGILIGLALALASLRVLDGLLFGVDPGDPLTLVAIAALLSAVTLAATAAPALRAARTDPARTLGS